MQDETGNITLKFTDFFKKFKNDISIITSGVAKESSFTFSENFNTDKANDIALLTKYKEAVENNLSPTQAFDTCLRAASATAQEYAQSVNAASISVKEYQNKAIQADITRQAENHSLKSTKILIDEYATGLNNCKLKQKEYTDAVAVSNPQLAKYLSNTNASETSMKGYAKSLIGAKLQTIGLQAASMALNAVIGIGIGLAISAAIQGIDYLIHREDKLIEKSEEAASTIKSLNDSYSSAKQTVDDCADSFIRLSKGVDLSTGKNLTLSDNDYQEFLDISNKLAETFPTLTRHYDENGNAIVQLEGNASDITSTLQELLEVEKAITNQEIVGNLPTLYEGINTKSKKYKNEIVEYQNAVDGLTSLTEDKDILSFDSQNGIKVEKTAIGYMLSYTAKNSDAFFKTYEGMHKALKALKYDYQELTTEYNDTGAPIGFNFEITSNDFNVDTFKHEFTQRVRQSLNEAENELAKAINNNKANWSGLLSSISAYLQTSDLYTTLGDSAQSAIQTIINGLDYSSLDFSKWEDVKEFIDTDIVRLFSEGNGDAITKFIDIQTKFNDDECSVSEYQKALDDISKALEELDDENKQIQFKIALGITDDQNTLQRIHKNLDLDNNELLNSWINSLNSSELNVVSNLSVDTKTATWDLETWKEKVQQELTISAAFDFKIADAEANFDNLQKAIQESLSSSHGLKEESKSSITSMFGSLDSFDSSKIFDQTATGIRLNTDELNKLQKEQSKIQKQKFDDSLTALYKKYDDLTDEIGNYTDKIEDSTDAENAEYWALIDKRNAIVDNINSINDMRSMYDGLTSAYAAWQNALASGEDGYIYDSIREGLEKAKELYDQGLVGTDKFRTYVELLTGQDLSGKSIDEVVAAYERLDKQIANTKYTAFDFLKEGNVGVENFLKAINQYNSDWAKQDKNGKWQFNFNVQELADAFGVGVEFIESMLYKLKDYGFEVNIDTNPATEKLEQLQAVAEKANKELKEKGLTKTTFDIDTTNIDKANRQIDEAKELINALKDSDGKLNLDSEDVKNAQYLLAALLRQKQNLEEPSIMKVDLSSIGNDAEEALSLLAELQKALNNLEIDKATGVDITKSEQKVQDVVNKINEIPDDIKKKLNLDTAEAKSALSNISDTKISVKTHLDETDVSNITNTLSGISSDMIVRAGVDSSKVSEYKPEEKSGTVEYAVAKFKSWLNMEGWKPPTKYGKVVYEAAGETELNGTAQATGTANVTGTSKANGDWGASKTETALMGEIKPEIWVHARTGKWELVNHPQFRKVEKGDIVFNGRQTEDLLKKGFSNSFGQSFLNGTAYDGGSNDEISTGNGGFKHGNSGSKITSSSSKSSSKSSKSSSKDKSDDPKAFDWIEVAIDRIERAIDRLKNTATSTYKALKTKLGATTSEITKVNQELSLQQKAYDRYIKQANSVGLSSSLAAKVRNGTIDINDYSSDTQELISDYQKWYEKALDCSEAIQELHETLASLYEDKFNNIQDDYDNQLSLLEHLTNTYNDGISKLEAKGYLESTKYYDALINVEKQNISVMNKELADLKKSFSEAMNSGEIEEYSDSWYDMQISINDVSEAIAEANTQLLEYSKTMREIEWGYFDYIQDRISQITQEADFLIGLMSNDKLYKDNGQFNDAGMATTGLHTQNYNVYMAQADMYSKEIEALNKDIAKDPYNTDLIARREELLELQQEFIISAEDEKNAIVDLVEEGINLELDALKDLIDAYEDSLDSAKDLYDYQKKIEDKTSNIATLEKQLTAYEGDTSEETKAKLQKIRVDLADAKEDLEETEYERYISDQKKLLDDMYTEYEEILNMRLDNIDALIADMITMVNDNASSIGATISDESEKVGYTLTEAMQNIWNGSINDVVVKYGDNFTTQLTTINQVLSAIQTNVAAMANASNKEATKTVTSTTKTTTPTKATSSSNKTSANTNTVSQSKAVTVGGQINAGSAKIYSTSSGGGATKQYFANDPIYTVLGENNGYWKVRWHKLSSGVTGWFKKGDVKAYKTGGLVDYTGLAQLDGTPNKPELVLNANDTKNFLALTEALRSMSASSLMPKDFEYPNNLTEIHNISDIVSRSRNFADAHEVTFGDINIEIPIEHVDDYNDIVSQMQKDNRFANMIKDMTVNQVMGGNSLAKHRHQWRGN